MCKHCQEERKFHEVPEKPRWHPLRFAEGQPVCGEILLSFVVVPDEYKYSVAACDLDLASRVKSAEMDVNMLILGLRNLQSPGILPVKKAFVKFNVKSLVPPNGSAV